LLYKSGYYLNSGQYYWLALCHQNDDLKCDGQKERNANAIQIGYQFGDLADFYIMVQ